MRLLVAGLGLAVAAAAVIAAPSRDKSQPAVAVRAAPSGLEKLGRGIDHVSLRDTTGRSVLWRDLAGRPRALFFGFTHCPSICPTTLLELEAARTRLGARGARLSVDFVTIDPERDTSEHLRTYVESFDRPARAFVGGAAETKLIADAFRASYRKNPGSAGEYWMDHTTTVYLLNARGVVVDTIPFGEPAAVFDAKLSRLLSMDRRGGA